MNDEDPNFDNDSTKTKQESIVLHIFNPKGLPETNNLTSL
jgi:hypothetical protein